MNYVVNSENQIAQYDASEAKFFEIARSRRRDLTRFLETVFKYQGTQRKHVEKKNTTILISLLGTMIFSRLSAYDRS